MEYPQELFYAMQAYDDDTLSDGAWQAMLESGADAWAAMKSEAAKQPVHIDTFDAFMHYLEWREKK